MADESDVFRKLDRVSLDSTTHILRVLHELGRMPRRGEAVELGGLELKVLRADRRRIETLRVTTPRDIDLKRAE